MGFLFGLMLGSMSSGGGTALPPSLGSIPFRCLAAFEISETEYEQCRRTTLRREIVNTTGCSWQDIDKIDNVCSYIKAVTWEIAGLRELAKAAQKKQTEAR